MDSPFPGLRSYRVNETDWFFGRDGMSDAMALKLAGQRFLAVVGESGCGKSSLVRAGLFPTLQSGLLADAGSRWRMLDMHPGGDPVGALSAALRKSGFAEGTDRETLARDPAAISAACRKQLGAENLLILVDQFEELFRFHAHRDEKAAFLQLLQEAVGQTETSVYVIVTMRSDFIGMCAQFRGLPEQINQGLYLVPRMTRENLRQAIQGPARLAGTEIESKLVQTLLNEIGSEPDQLPVLQHALMRTWNNWVDRQNPDDPVREDPDYARTGRLQKALSNHADEALEAAAEAIGEDVEALAQQVFVLLRDRDVNGQEVRRPTRVDEIRRVTGADTCKIQALIEEFRKPGRTFLNATPDEWTDDAAYEGVEYDVTHESFIRKWERLRDRWIPAELSARRIYVRLAQQALDSDAVNPSYMDGAVLDQSLDWAYPPAGTAAAKPTTAWAERYCHDFGDAPTEGLFEKAMAFLDASRASRERRRAMAEEARQAEIQTLKASAKKRLAYGASAVLLLGVVVAAFVARNATRQKEHATVLNIASSALLTSQDPWQATRSALLAGESLRREPALLAAAVLSRSLSLLPKPLPGITHKGAAFVSYSPDGAQIGTAGGDGSIQVWDADGGKNRQTIQTDRKLKAFSLLAAHALIVSDENGLELLPLNGSGKTTLCPDAGKFAVSPGGNHIAARCGESLVLASLEGGKFTARSISPAAVPAQDLDPDFLAISDSGNWVASATAGTGVKVLSAATRHLTGPVSLGDIAALGFTSDDQVVVVRQDGIVKRWNPSDASAGDDYPLEGFGKEDRFHTMIAGQRGAVVVQSNAESLFAWSITGEQLAVADSAGGVMNMAAADSQFAALDSSGLVRRWALPALMEPPFLGKIGFFSPDGKWLMQRDEILHYRLTSTTARWSEDASGTATGNYPVAFQSGGNRVALRVNQAAPHATPLFSGLELRPFEDGRIGAAPLIPAIRAIGTLSASAFSPDGSRLVTANRGGARGNLLSLWDMKTGQAIGQQPIGNIAGAFFSPDGQTVYWDDGGQLQAWKPAEKQTVKIDLAGITCRPVWASAAKGGVAACVESSGANAGTMVVWRYPDWKQAVKLDNEGAVSNLVLSGDGSLILTSTPDGTFRVWDWARRSLVAAIPTHKAVSAMAYREDGRIVALEAGRLKSYLWRVSDLSAALCQSAGRDLTLAEWKAAQLPEADFPRQKLCR